MRYCSFVDRDNIERQLDSLDVAIIRIEDSLMTVCDEVLRLRHDVATATGSPVSRWSVVSSGWGLPGR